MTENVHLLMSVKGEPLAVDLFHVILFAIDKEYPIKPMRKAGDAIKVCKRCKGFIWDNCIIGAREIQVAARQAAEETDQLISVKVHAWQIAKNCGCYESYPLSVDAYNPRFKSHTPVIETDSKVITLAAPEPPLLLAAPGITAVLPPDDEGGSE